MRFPYPIIFVHGIQGAWLKNQYPVDYQDDIYWTGVMIKKFEKLHLNPSDPSVDSDIDRFIFPHQAVPLIYESIVSELRTEVTPHTYMFTYDWRKDNRLSAEKLGEFAELVMKKAAVHAEKKDPVPDKVVLVGHSMGGLVIKWYVEEILKEKAPDRVDRIITIATPYKGSLKAVEAILPGARNFFGLEAQKAMRKAARTLPGLYQLLPSWPDAVVNGKTGKPVDIFRAENWQKNLVAKMEKNYGKTFFQKMLDDARENYGKTFFQKMLDDARDFTDHMKKSYAPNMKNRFFCVWGKGSETLRQVTVDASKDNRFDFKGAKTDKDGDGTVHSASSKVPSKASRMDTRNVISDLIGGQHAQMPNHDGVQDYIIKLLTQNKLIESFTSTL